MGNIEKDIYEYKDREYSIVTESKMKIGGTWINVIIYQCEYDNLDGRVWVREEQEFWKLFKHKRTIYTSL